MFFDHMVLGKILLIAFAEGYFRHEDRLHSVRSAGFSAARRVVEGWRRLLQLQQALV